MAAVVEPERRVGKVIDGKYELRKLLGTGSTGAVYEAWHRFTGRAVAVKVLHDHMVGNREAVGRFMREARAASAIGHPVIVAVLDAGVTGDDGPPYMVQELLEGEEMEAAMRRRALSIADIVEIGRQLLDGLGAAHHRSIVHRDVKPENIFLSRGVNGELQVKLVDFGVAKAMDASKTLTGVLTLPGNTVGTPYYMSPEQCKADPVDARADLWSVGAVLFHAAVGRPPFDTDKALGDLLYKIVMTRAQRAREARPDLPDNLAEAIDRALEPRPADRWPNARAMSDCLRRSSASIAGLDWDDD
jgi:serine/threonine-protein kinase